MNKLLILATIVLTGCAPMTPEQAARYDATLYNSLQVYQRSGQQRMDYLRAQQQSFDSPWPSQMRPALSTCAPNWLNPAQVDCVSR